MPIRALAVLLVGLFLAVPMLTLPASAVAAEAIGKVKTAESNAAIQRGEERIAAAVGTMVQRYDVLETDDTGSMGVIFNDDTTISVGPKSKLTINEFVYNPKQGQFSFVSKLAQGTLSYISGDIAKKSPESVAVQTPSATIGIRGTSFLIKIIEDK
jgi:hypothetical protein